MTPDLQCLLKLLGKPMSPKDHSSVERGQGREELLIKAAMLLTVTDRQRTCRRFTTHQWEAPKISNILTMWPMELRIGGAPALATSCPLV